MDLQPPKWGRFYIWQTHMYGTGKVDGDAPAEIFRWRPMPCTPAGDFVGEVKTGLDAISMVEHLNAAAASLDDAKTYFGEMTGRDGRGD